VCIVRGEERYVAKRPSDMTPITDLAHGKETGPFRPRRPVSVNLRPPCNHACPAGEDIQARTPEELAALADSRLRATREELAEALRGRLNDHQRTLLRMQLHRVRYLDQPVGALDAAVAKRLASFEVPLRQLDTIPGIPTAGRTTCIGGISHRRARPPR